MARTSVFPDKQTERKRQNDALRERMREALIRSGKNPTQIAVAIGRDRNYFRDFLKQGPKKESVGSNELRLFADQTAVTVGWLHGYDPEPVPSPSPAHDERVLECGGRRVIPLYGDPIADQDDGVPLKVLSHLPCPPALQKVQVAYAVGISGRSMEPRYRPGEIVYVNASRSARTGEDVIVQVDLKGQRLAYVKELVRIDADGVILKQHNPEKQLFVSRQQLRSMHVINGMASYY